MRKDAMIFAVAAVFAATLAFHFGTQVREGNRLTAELRQQVEELKAARIADAARAAASAVVLPPAVAPVAAPVPPVAQSMAAPANAPTPVTTNCDALLAQVKQSAALTTAQWATELKLTPGETRRVTEIREAQIMGSLSCGSGGGSSASPEILQAQLEAALGPARFEQLQEFNASRTTNQNMATFGSRVAAFGAPLDAEQSRQLTATILDEDRRSRREASSTVAPSDPYARLAYEEENLKLTEERFARILEAGESYLLPAQLAQLRTSMTQQAESMRASVKRMRTSVEAGLGIPSTQSIVIINTPQP